MMDVALLTDNGIVFCSIPNNTLDRFRQLALETNSKERAFAIIEVEDNVKYEVRCENILVRYEQRR